MPDYKTIFLVVGIIILIAIFTRKAILKQKRELENPVRPPKVKPKKNGHVLTDVQFEIQWKSMAYLLFLAALGNLYSAYISFRSAMSTMSTVLWIDGALSVIAAVTIIIFWRKRVKDIAFAYMGIIILQVMFYLATGQYLIAMVHVFPIVLVYIVVKPVWDSLP